VTSAAGAVALDTSAAVPYLMLSHPAHTVTRRQVSGRTAHLTTHSLAETYSVLTRLPGDARVTPVDVVTLLSANFADSIAPRSTVSGNLPAVLAPLGIAGGAVYDALVGLAAQAAGIVLVTRDARAIPTYTAVGASIEIVG
jgi:predicted nucleic acid-binding protein